MTITRYSGRILPGAYAIANDGVYSNSGAIFWGFAGSSQFDDRQGEDDDNDEGCEDDDCEDKATVIEIIAATVRGWWSSMYGGGRDDVETLAENGMVEEAQKLEKHYRQS